jgi:hypothetical protein
VQTPRECCMQHHPGTYAHPVHGPNAQKDDARCICKTSAMSPCTSTTLPPLSAPHHCQDRSNDRWWTRTRSWSWGGLRKAQRVRASVPGERHKNCYSLKRQHEGTKAQAHTGDTPCMSADASTNNVLDPTPKLSTSGSRG